VWSTILKKLFLYLVDKNNVDNCHVGKNNVDKSNVDKNNVNKIVKRRRTWMTWYQRRMPSGFRMRSFPVFGVDKLIVRYPRRTINSNSSIWKKLKKFRKHFFKANFRLYYFHFLHKSTLAVPKYFSLNLGNFSN